MAAALLNLVRCYSRFSPIHRGKSRLKGFAAHAVSSLAVWPEKRMTFSAGPHDLPLWLPASTGIAVLCEFFGGYEVEDLTRCLQSLQTQENPVLLDIGANCGLYSLFAAAHCPRARVISVEADPDVADIFQRNRQENASRIDAQSSTVSLHRCALGNEVGQATLQRSWDNGWGSILSDHTPRQLRGVITVPLQTGDALLSGEQVERIDYCKIDVEGAELLVLQGLDHTLREQRIHLLQIELNRVANTHAGDGFEPLLSFLRERNYRLTEKSRPLLNQSGWTCENVCFEPFVPQSA
jgi:FkbM family methyltransferase